MPKVIPEDVKNFILLHIDSIAQLEGLLIFHGDRMLRMECDELARRLYITHDEAGKLLGHLLEHDFLQCSGKGETAVYRYGPKNDTDAEIIDRLADAYSRYLVPVTNLVHEKHKHKIQRFADAFWIRKEESQ